MDNLLFTGSNGFLGKNSIFLLSKTYNVITLDIQDAEINCNIASRSPVINEKIDIVLHAAGKAHIVPKNKVEKQLFFDINYQGTINLCKSFEEAGYIPKSFIFISSVAVYGCDVGENIVEEHPLNGNTPYALSKIMAEKFLIEWCTKNNVLLSIVRPSLIAGPNPPGNLGDMIKGINSGRYLNIAKGKARKSIILACDIARIAPLLAERGGIFNLSDSNHPSIEELGLLIANQLGKKKPLSIPYWIAKLLALFGNMIGKKALINSEKLHKIVNSLTFSNEKARIQLGWEPLNVLQHFKIKM